MNVVITGGAGFLGQRLARRLLGRGTLSSGANADERIDRLVLVDVVPAPDFDDRRVRVIAGDLADPAVVRDAIDASVGSVFHLAAVVSGQAEADFDLGMRVNLDAGRAVLEACRSTGRKPRLL